MSEANKKAKHLSSGLVAFLESVFGVAFDRPIGATADVTELDYIAALHQTDVAGGIRKDGSIQDVDISLFLSSRYGVKQTPDEVEQNILPGLGSTDRSMDMMQLVSLLLIPTLREQQEERSLVDDNKDHDSDNDLLLYTVEMLLHDVTGSRQPKALTRTLIRQIFQAYGEEALAQNEELVQAMLEQAGGGTHERVLLDAKTFCKALTADVQDYDVANTHKLSTTYEDVMAGNDGDADDHSLSLRKEAAAMDSDDCVEAVAGPGPKRDDDEAYNVPTMYTAPQIDNAADTYRSKPLILFQWTFFVLSFQTYLIRFLSNELLGGQCSYTQGVTWVENAGAFFCTIGISVAKWILVMLAMSIAGVVYFGVGGIGNNLQFFNPLYLLIGTFIMGAGTWLPPLFYRDSNLYSDIEFKLPQVFLMYSTAVLGSAAALLAIWNAITLLIPTASRLWKWLECIVIPEGVHTESNIKQAASYKMGSMVNNALEVHRVKKQETVVPTHFGQALLNFAEATPKFEQVGGMSWLLKSIWNRSLFKQEGVLFSGRLASTNFIQFFIAIFILIFGIVVIQSAADNYDTAWERADDLITDTLNLAVEDAVATASNDAVDRLKELVDTSGVNTTAFADDLADNFTASFQNVFFPTEKRMVVIPLRVGVGIAFTCACYITLVVLPSASSTALKFRSGVLPFVHDPRVRILRMAPDQTAFLRGVMYWGCLLASGLLGGFWALLVFLYMWQVTAATAQQLTASLLGAFIVIGVHAVVSISIRNIAASGYYRKKPLVANTTLLIRECGLVALTRWFAFIRGIRLFLTAIFFIGRIDSPFLHDGLGQVGNFRIDREPYMFQMEILQHEAHRHPFIETLGVMYLLKLRHRDTFCSFAGSSWRLIFVYVLMPWLSKYRALRRPRPELESDVEDGSGAPPLPPPLRAVTLVDPQAYALRAVSLVPVASGYGSGSPNTLGGGRRLSVMSGGLSLLQEANVDDEVRELREENERLKNQLRLTTLAPATTLLSRGTVPTLAMKQTRSPTNSPEDPKPSRGTKQTRSPPTRALTPTSPGMEVDSRGRPMPEIPEARSIKFKESEKKSPGRQSMKREGSQGLSTLRPPQPRTRKDDDPQISFSDFTQFSV